MIDFSSVRLSPEDVQRILSLEESWAMDKKSKDILPSKLSNTVSAFANASGGEIYVGLSHGENKNEYYWDGFSVMEECNQIVEVISALFPNYDDCRFEFCYDDADVIVLHITIQKTLKVIRATNGKAYLRIGVQNIPQETQEQIRQMEYDKGIYSYEDELTACTYTDICNSTVLKRFIQQVVPRTNSFDWLKSQFLMDAHHRIKVAGVVLYSETPQAVIPKHSGIRILKYHTDLAEGTRETLDNGFPISIEGDIYSIIVSAVEKTKRIVEESSVVNKSGFISKVYPDVTLHEIITNAVLHRDYSIAEDVQIRIYTNRIEVESPGKLPGHITTENILIEQFSRNPRIVRLISKFPSPPNKDAGEGLNTAFRAMVKMNLKQPQIIEKDNSVLVVIKHERLADPELIICDYLKDNPSINNSEGRVLTGISDTIKMKDVFVRLRERGIIEIVPGLKGNATRWRLKSGAPSITDSDESTLSKSDQYTLEEFM